MTESYRWWTYHIILDHIMPSENVSVHLWLHHAINERLTAHVINVHIMTTHNTSWHLATHHVVSRHIMYHVVYEHDVWAYGTWNMEHTFDSPIIPGGLWCFAHGTGWFITRTLDTEWFMVFHPWNRMVYHTDIGHRCKEMTFNLYRVVYDVSPMEPDGLSHGHWTQMQGDDF